MNHWEKFLEELGFSSVEAKLYLGLLKRGASSVKEISDFTQVKRVTAHFALERLIEQGLVIQSLKGKKRMLVAQHPEKLKEIIEKKISFLGLKKKEVDKMIDLLMRKNVESFYSSDRLKIRYYSGKKEVYQIYEEVLRAKEVRSFVNLSLVHQVFPENENLFKKSLRRNTKLRIWEIVEDSEIANFLTREFAKSKRYHFKLTSKIKLPASDLMIFDDCVAIVDLSREISGTILADKDFYQALREIFNFIWSII